VQDLTESDNGVQHQLDGIAPSDVSMQFFIPSHSFPGSQAVGKLGWGGSPELSVPASGFINPESDGSIGVILKPGLYVWKMNKRFDYNGNDVWVPVRAERQEISFVPDRVNACNQCHQERSQANLEKYEDSVTIASQKMLGDLSGVPDISSYNAYYSVPDFHTEIMPMLMTCAGCHDASDKLDLSNATGARSQSPAWLRLVRGAYNLDDSSGDVVPYVTNSINPMGFDDNYGPAPFLWALLLDDDLTVPPAPNYPDAASRSIARPGDYGATYDPRIVTAINDINTLYDHSGHWTAAEVQKFITYTTTQTMVGLSDRIAFDADGSGYTSTPAGQKAYQAIVRRCFDCHNNHNGEGIADAGFGQPQVKRFRSANDLKSKYLRLVIDSHLANKNDTKYSQFRWQSDINASMRNTLSSARDRINFDNTNESQVLVYARCDALAADIDHPVCLTPGDPDYDAIANWVQGGTAVNQAPTLDGGLGPIVINEYDEPAMVGPITWNDPDGELSQLFLNPGSSSEHVFNDTMLSLQYDSLTAAQVETYAILGDRGSREFEFVVSDGITNSQIQTLPVTVTSDYVVPEPEADLPDFTAFYTVRATGELRRIDETGADQSVGFIPGYTADFSTVYRRADRGWLYFVNQTEQRIHAVDETNANLLFTIDLDHSPNKETDQHKQTVYLIWWRPAEYDNFGNLTRAGELQGLLESKQSDSMDGDFYVGLGDGDAGGVVVPEYRARIGAADNVISVYVWRRATFMTQWIGDGIDKLNVLNLVTGKARNLSEFSFEAKNYMGTDYLAKDYWNVRAVLLSEDGAFYGFNKDLNSTATLFNFDPLERVQVEVPLPAWLEDLLDHPENYGTPFVVVPPRS
jgi:hypothetical protein